MGLFGDLPPPSASPKPRAAPDRPPSARTAAPGAAAAVAPKPSALKSSLKGKADAPRGEDAGGTGRARFAEGAEGSSREGGRKRGVVMIALEAGADASEAPSRRRVRFHTFAEVAEDKVTSAIAKIAAHIGTPAKFKKAAGLARQLLEGGALNSDAGSMNSAVNSTHASQFFGVLEAAMALLRRAGGGAGGMVVGGAGDVGGDYEALFAAAQERKELFSPHQQHQLDVWCLRAVLGNSLRTDDSFQFSKAVSRVQKEVEGLPEAAEEDEREEAAAFSGVAMTVQAEGGQQAGAEGEREAERVKEAKEVKEALKRGSEGLDAGEGDERGEDNGEHEDMGGEGTRDGGVGGGGEAAGEEDRGGEGGGKDKAKEGGERGSKTAGVKESEGGEGDSLEDTEDPFGLGDLMGLSGKEGGGGVGSGGRKEGEGEGNGEEEEEEEDPFGLGEIIERKRTTRGERREERREERERRRREAEEERRRVEEEERRLLRERREALLLCIRTATDMYRHKWAQTAIDMLAQHAYEHRTRFTARQQAAIESLWVSVKQQQHERKHGAVRAGTGGRLDVTAFERLQRHYEGEAISIRKGVGGGGGRSTITWLG